MDSSWANISGNLPHSDINSIAIQAEAIYAALHDYGVFRSLDNGATWTKLNVENQEIDYCIVGASENKVFVGTRQMGVYVSADKGETWQGNLLNVPPPRITNIYAQLHFKKNLKHGIVK